MVASADLDYEANRWYYKLKHRMSQKNIPVDGNAFENAQRLLDFPIRRTLEKIYDEKMGGTVDEE